VQHQVQAVLRFIESSADESLLLLNPIPLPHELDSDVWIDDLDKLLDKEMHPFSVSQHSKPQSNKNIYHQFAEQSTHLTDDLLLQYFSQEDVIEEVEF
jgi:hypothetical protein